MSILGIAEFQISINKNDQVDELFNEIYNPSTGIIQKLTSATSKIEVLQEGLSLAATKAEMISSKNKKFKFRYIRDYLDGANVINENRWVEIQAYKGSLNVLKGMTPTSNKSIVNASYCTDGNYDDTGRYTYTSGTGMSYLQFDLGEIRDDIDFIKVWHYFGGSNVIYKGTKTAISEDGVNWINLYDGKENGIYREAKDGSIIAVNQGAIIESMLSRLQSAEIKITPDAIKQTVTSSMANEFSESGNLLDKAAKFVSTEWKNHNTQNVNFDDKLRDSKGFAMLNIALHEVGEIKHTLKKAIQLKPDFHYCFSFKAFQEKVLNDQRFKFTVTIKGLNLTETKVYDGQVLSDISYGRPRTYAGFNFQTSNSVSQTVDTIIIKMERKTSINTDATLCILEPQFEEGAFSSQYMYPYSLGIEEENSYREQTAKSITEKVSNSEYNSYKEQTADRFTQVISDTNGQFSQIEQRVDNISLRTEIVEGGVNNINGTINDLNTSVDDIINMNDTIFKDGIVSEAEREALKQMKVQLQIEKEKIRTEVNSLANSSELAGTQAKTDLLAALNKIISKLDLVFIELDKEINK